MAANIDQLAPTRSLIDLASYGTGDFGLDDLQLAFIFDDIVLVEYVDLTAQKEVYRNGILLPTNTLQKAWRKGRVILTGPGVKYTSKGDIVIFPNSMGVTVSNMDVEGHGKVTDGIFLNENRIFGICKPKTDGINSDTNS